MKVLQAEECGFCMGVAKAVDRARAVASECGPIRTYGPLVHNRRVVESLEKLGIRATGEIERGDGTPILIRSHGAPPDERNRLKSLGVRVEDATCPDVGRIQSFIKGRTAKGFAVIILGDRGHAEVRGLAGFAGEGGTVIETPREVDSLDLSEGIPVCLVSQSTQEQEAFDETARRLQEIRPDAEIRDTICDSTKNRQSEARRLARDTGAVVVVGGLHSANTTRLAEVVREEGAVAFHVESAEEIDVKEVSRFPVIGVTAGASTPNEDIAAVVRLLEGL